ncbi:peroxiredoxin Q/BCP [Azospirillum fermentarium]|uniref:thioredoxin-dependent thiol peroxidase n=1 Tax=Azospirillum fermentarium TaxID=1233114 RepID=UPI002226C685|nr:thioredoxin-dependent thiol peroxidase [Azospirillum fermentarium]MCW2246234.1 peroxiredoxin Q/BCP [Azospirillum fermentarium]
MTDTAAPTAAAPAIVAGMPAPDFTMPTDGGGSVTLSALRGTWVILYFYPKDDTSGCTKEACGFRDQLPDFTGADAVVIGVSKDSVASHDKFKAKYELPFTLASDKDAGVAEAYGVWVEKSMYGRKYMGLDRATFLIDPEGVVKQVWRKVKVTGHVEAVLKALKTATP